MLLHSTSNHNYQAKTPLTIAAIVTPSPLQLQRPFIRTTTRSGVFWADLPIFGHRTSIGGLTPPQCQLRDIPSRPNNVGTVDFDSGAEGVNGSSWHRARVKVYAFCMKRWRWWSRVWSTRTRWWGALCARGCGWVYNVLKKLHKPIYRLFKKLFYVI